MRGQGREGWKEGRDRGREIRKKGEGGWQGKRR